MLYQKKRRKINLSQTNNKIHQNSTRNSDRHPSNQRQSLLSVNHNKSFTKNIIKRTPNKYKPQQQSSPQRKLRTQKESNEDIQKKVNLAPNTYFQPNMITADQLKKQKQLDNQKMQCNSNIYSTCSLQLNVVDQQVLNANKKKFKLYCRMKKNKVNQKKQENEIYQKETLKMYPSSWIKNSVFSKNSEQHGSASTNKITRQISSKRKIDLTQKIRQIKNKQKQKILTQKEKILSLNTLGLEFKQKDNQIKLSDRNSIRSKKSLQKKHSTVNIKKFAILDKLKTKEQSKIQISFDQSTLSTKQAKQTQNNLPIKKSTQGINQNKILPQFSQVLEESVKKMSQIKKNQDTISRSIKAHYFNSIDHSRFKNIQQTQLNLSINSIYKDTRKSYGCILQTTEIRQSALRKQIESSLSELEKTRQKINIEKFKQPKTIGQMGSQISAVEENMNTIQKIQFHIELINTLSNFVYKSTELEYLMQDWDELNFLIYKKFYLERMKVLNFLKKYPIKNPFCIKRANIETKQVLKTLRENQAEIKRIRNILETENMAIKKNFQVFYNQFSKQQYGQKINLFEYDNFSHWIYKELWDEIQLFSYSQSHNKKQLQDRICRSLQAGFLISQLNGNYVTPFEDAQFASHQNRQKVYIDDNLKVFQKYVLNKKK